MNKTDLINEVAKVVRTKREAQAAVDTILSSIVKALRRGDAVTLVGFGTFRVSQRRARRGRNPQTGAPIHIEARRVPRFIAGKALKDVVSVPAHAAAGPPYGPKTEPPDNDKLNDNNDNDEE